MLAQDAPDDAVVAYAHAKELVLVTHDRGCARRALASGLPHLWIRTREMAARDRLHDALNEIEAAFDGGATRVTLFSTIVRTAGKTDT